MLINLRFYIYIKMNDNIFNKYRYCIDFDFSKYYQFLNLNDLSENMIENEVKRKYDRK